MDQSKKTVVTIYENDYEFLRLSEVVKEVKYFDTIYEMLVEKGEVVYKDYIIKYKSHNHKNKYRFIAYDKDEVLIKSYSRAWDLANDYGVTDTSVVNWFKHGNEYTTKEGDTLVRFKI
jgi:hypothetical protein